MALGRQNKCGDPDDVASPACASTSAVQPTTESSVSRPVTSSTQASAPADAHAPSTISSATTYSTASAPACAQADVPATAVTSSAPRTTLAVDVAYATIERVSSEIRASSDVNRVRDTVEESLAFHLFCSPLLRLSDPRQKAVVQSKRPMEKSCVNHTRLMYREWVTVPCCNMALDRWVLENEDIRLDMTRFRWMYGHCSTDKWSKFAMLHP